MLESFSIVILEGFITILFVSSFSLTSFEPLVRRVNDNQIKFIVTKLNARTGEPSLESSITSTALRTVISNVPATGAIARVLAEEMLPTLLKDISQSVDSCDVLVDLIKRFGSSFTVSEVSASRDALMIVVNSGQGIIRKRAISCLGLLARYLSVDQNQILMQDISQGLDSSDLSKTITLISLAGVLAKADSGKFKAFVPRLFPSLLSSLKLNDLGSEEDEEYVELREVVLTTLESILVSDPSALEPFVPTILEICTTFLKYDPNYIVDEETEDNEIEDNEVDDKDDTDMEDEDEDDEFALSGEDDFSDDEDQSWKLRRNAAKLTSALVTHCPSLLPQIESKMLDFTIRRIQHEREDTVKLEIFNALTGLIKEADEESYFYSSKNPTFHKRRSSDASMILEVDPQDLILQDTPKIVRISLKELKRNSAISNMKQTVLNGVLVHLVKCLDQVPSKELEEIVKGAEDLSTINNSALMPDILTLLSVILKQHSLETLQPVIDNILRIVSTGINDSYYKVSGAALEVVLDLLNLYRDSNSVDTAAVGELEEIIIEKASGTVLDFEIREKAVQALGQFLAVIKLPKHKVYLGSSVLLELLENDTLRLVTVKAIGVLAEPSGVNVDSLSAEWLTDTSKILCLFLKQTSRPLRLGSLNALLSIARSKTTTIQCKLNIAKELLEHIDNNVSDGSDIQIVGVALTILAALYPDISSSPTYATEASVIVEFAVGLVDKPLSLHVSVELLQLLQVASSASQSGSIFNALIDIPDVTLGVTSWAIAVCVVKGGLENKAKNFVTILAEGDGQTANKEIQGALNVVGNIAKLTKLDVDSEIIYKYFSSSDEAIRTSAAQVLGSLAATNPEIVLPVVLQRLRKSRSETYLNLVAVRETILEWDHSSPTSRLLHGEQERTTNVDGKVRSLATDEIWNTLEALELSTDSSDDGERSVTAECLGRLSIINPEHFLPLLKNSLSSSSASTRSTAVSAVKYTFGQSHERYDNLLRPIIVDFLALVEDKDLATRQVALSALVSAIHNKPHLLLAHLPLLVPLLYKETLINQSLIRSVQMGPFKHKVDDGLELRKTAYETTFTLISTLQPDWLVNLVKLDDMFDRVIAGLDDEHDIQVLSCVILGRLVTVDLSVLSTRFSDSTTVGETRLDSIVRKFTALLSKNLGENALKQEHEKRGEIIRNIISACQQIDEAIKTSIGRRIASGLSDVELANWNRFTINILSKYR